MSNIKILRLTLENFKCHRHLELVLDGKNVTIYGDNATGKTSVYDALTWLLFGKDSAGNGEKNIEIKPLDLSGAVEDHKAITSVEAELLCGGETVTLKRTYREVWGTKRGSSQEVYEGNTSEYFVNGVPCKKYAFDDQIKAMVPEDVFRLLTSVEHFPNILAWQKRRAVLFDMAGTRTDREIMEGKSNEEYTAQLAKLKGALLTAFQPIYEFLVPALISLMKVATAAVQAVAHVAAFLGGKSVKEYAANAKALHEEAKAIEETGKAAKKAQKSLAGFDEINKLSGNAEDSTADSAMVAPDFSDFSTEEYAQKIDELTLILSGALLALGAILTFAGANIPLGIGLMALGAVGLATEAVMNWSAIVEALGQGMR